MRNFGAGRKNSVRSGRVQAALLAGAATAVFSAGAALGQTTPTTLIYDTSAGTTWDLSTANWYQTPGSDQVWGQGSTADLTSSAVITVGADISVSGIIFDGTFGAGDSATKPNVVASASGYLDLGSNSTFTMTQNTGNHEFITVPIHGTNDNIDINVNTTSADAGAIILAGDMSAFTGNITVNNAFGAATFSTGASLHIDTNLSGGTINLDEYASLYNGSQITGGGTTGDPWTGAANKSPNYFTVADNIVLNYNAANENGATNVTNNIGSANGPSGTSKIEVFTGVISSPSGTTPDGLNIVSNLNIGGASQRGTVVLANHETYNGTTTVSVSDASGVNNGMVQFATENALPATTALIIGSGSAVVGVTDLDGYDQTVASLATGTSSPTASSVGNIYNLSINDSALGFQQNISNNGVQNPGNQYVTLTISPAVTTNTVFSGDIGDSSVAINPLNDNAPYKGNTTANTNIALVINGPTGGGTHTLALAPLGAHSDEYTGPTAVNSNAILVLGRTSTGTSGMNYTITGNGTVTVGNGATLSSVSTAAGAYAGGTAGNIVLQKGSSFLPGQAIITSAAATNGGLNYAFGTAALSPTNVGSLSTSNIEFDSGASMTFTLAGTSAYDAVTLVNSDGSTGTLTLANPTNDATPDYTINIDGTNLTSGTYPLITGNITGDQTNPDNTSQFITLNTTGVSGGGLFKLLDTGSALLLQAITSTKVLQWDPTGGGIDYDNNLDVYESGGTWADSSPFVDLSNNNTEVSWNNTDYSSYDVLIGNDKNQGGDVIHLGEPITVGGVLRFQGLYQGYNYTIANDGNALTLNGGISVSTGAATPDGNGGFTNPSAEIDAPIILGADQTWQIDSGEYLLIGGAISGSHTLTISGINGTASNGIVNLTAAGGSIGGLDVQSGTVWLTAPDAIGAAPISLDGGGVEFSVNGTPANAISFGSNGGSIGALAGYSLTLPTAFSTAGALGVIGAGNVSFTGNLSANQLHIAATGIVTLNGNNTFTTGINATAGTIVPASLASLGTGPISLINATLALSNISSLPNNIVTTGNSGVQNNAFITTNVNLTLAGAISGHGNLILPGNNITYTFAGANTLSQVSGPGSAGGAINVQGSGDTLVVTNPTGLGNGTLVATGGQLTVEIDNNPDGSSLNVTSGSVRTNAAANTINKTGAGTWTLAGYGTANSVPGSVFNLQEGALAMKDYRSMGSTSAVNLNFNLSPGTTLYADFASTTARVGGSVNVDGASVIQDNGAAGDSYFAASTANVQADGTDPADTWTISGNSLMDEKQVYNGTQSVLRTTNPVVVTSGAVFTIECDNTAGGDNNDALVFSGPANVTNPNLTDSTQKSVTPDTFNTFTIQSGATVIETGSGSVRFGRTTSQGIAIIGNGAANSSLPNDGESVLQLQGSDCYLTDLVAAYNIPTELLVAGSGNQGLRIEAPMNAAYTSSSSGTTGLFGTTTVDTDGSVYTVYSPNRAMNLSTPYNYLDINNNVLKTITPSGTLTLAATDAAGAAGTITAGPSVMGAVSLALGNGAGSGGTLTYIIDPASPDGGNFTNFAGLNVEQNAAVSNAAVIAQLQMNSGMTKIPVLNITGGASLDITNQGLAVDPATGPAPTAQIVGYLKASYDKGAWDLPGGIGSSQVSAVPGTSIGYAENDLLPTPYTDFGGQTVDNNAVLVRFTWLGDLNLDGVVDNTDLGMMSASGTTWATGDLNYDGKVNQDDWSLFFLGDAEQTGQLPLAVPEPAAASLLIAGAGLLLRRRRRS